MDADNYIGSPLFNQRCAHTHRLAMALAEKLERDLGMDTRADDCNDHAANVFVALPYDRKNERFLDPRTDHTTSLTVQQARRRISSVLRKHAKTFCFLQWPIKRWNSRSRTYLYDHHAIKIDIEF